ncbi:MAG TPA: hypothetical protein VNQ76_17290, partial [Planctomicrobium sp.]|nr:hypothetical protein [Planctomicrobium sp.]
SVQDRSRTEDPEPTPVGAGDDQPTEEKVSEKPAVENAPTEKTSVENVPPEGEKSQNDNGGERPAGRGPGGRSSRREAFANNILHLWKRTDLSVTEWTEKLDKLPTDVPIIAVMVQCYSGGFGNFVFKGGNPANGLAGHARAGFFSTVPDRVAAGCTPKVNEAEYREYSSYFFEALCGESRTGQPVTSPDYDQDGQTSFLEAHAYTVLTADTIDIPVRTTDVYLRQVSTINGKEGLLTANSPITALLAYANPTERAVVEGLSQRFDLTGSDRGREVDDAIKAKRAEKQKVEDELRKHRQKVTDIKKEIGNVVKNRWPEISSHWHPGVARILTEEGETVRNTILEHPRYTELRKKEDEIKALSAESDQQELQVVKLERLKYWLETLALKANLTDNAKEAGLRRIGELESTFLTTKRAVAEIES